MDAQIVNTRRGYRDQLMWDVMKNGQFVVGAQTESEARTRMEELQRNDWKYLCCYVRQGLRDPERWIEYIRLKGWTFENAEFEENSDGRVFFHGNITEYSAAFRFLILDADLVNYLSSIAPEVPCRNRGVPDAGLAAPLPPRQIERQAFSLNQAALWLATLATTFPGCDFHARLAETVLSVGSLDMALQAFACGPLEQIALDEATAFLRRAMAGDIVPTRAGQRALAGQVPPSRPALLPGVWTADGEDTFFRYYNAGNLWIEARLVGDQVRLIAKAMVVIGGVLPAVQWMGDATVPANDHDAIATAVRDLEKKLLDALTSR